MGCLALLSATNFCEMEPSKSKNAVFIKLYAFRAFFWLEGWQEFRGVFITN